MNSILKIVCIEWYVAKLKKNNVRRLHRLKTVEKIIERINWTISPLAAKMDIQIGIIKENKHL